MRKANILEEVTEAFSGMLYLGVPLESLPAIAKHICARNAQIAMKRSRMAIPRFGTANPKTRDVNNQKYFVA